MRIAIFHELGQGGARRAVNEIANKLKLSHQVDLYIVDDYKNLDEVKYFSNTFFYQFVPKIWRSGDWKTKLYKDTVELVNLYKLHKQISKDIDEGQYDLVFVHPSKYTQAPFVLRLLKTKKIYYCEEILRMVYEKALGVSDSLSMQKKLYEKTIRFLRKLIDKENILSADLIIANSKNTQHNIKKAYGIKSKVASLGVDADFFKPQRTKKNIDVLYIGSKNPVEGYKLFREIIPDIRKQATTYEQITEEKWISDKILKSLYQRSKIVLCLYENEPFGLIPLEAGACEAAVVAVDSGGYRETIINNKTGFLVKIDAKQFGKIINELLSDEELVSKIGQEARQNILSHWTWEIKVREIEQILSGFCENES